ncbi:MAG: hypothetical protein C0501_07220 [Isosphaera sp.]|nr:hypothetical protein [Isosphaera sp.]
MHPVRVGSGSGLAVLVAAALAVPPAGEASGAEPRELKIVAQRAFVDSNDGAPPISFTRSADKPVEPLVIRSAEELAAASPKGRQAKDPAAAGKDADLQKEVEGLLMNALKVEKIDWEKQMVVAVSEKAAYRVPPRWEFTSLKVDGDKMAVEVGRKGGEGYGAYGTPWAVAVVERFDGKVEFRGFPKR